MRINHSTRQGFTLIEVMIVATLIGMMASIAIPNFVKARSVSRRSACINNLRLLGGAVEQWAFEKNKSGADPVTLDNVVPYLKGPVLCPAGGITMANSYELTDVQTLPACIAPGGGSVNGHFLPQ